MTISSRFDIGNVVVVFDYIAKEERVLVVRKIESWDLYKGFEYVVMEYKGFLKERYDEVDFSENFEIRGIYKDVNRYEERGGVDEEGCY